MVELIRLVAHVALCHFTAFMCGEVLVVLLCSVAARVTFEECDPLCNDEVREGSLAAHEDVGHVLVCRVGPEGWEVSRYPVFVPCLEVLFDAGVMDDVRDGPGEGAILVAP